MDDIFIQVKGIGYVFLLDKRMRHNLISPAFLSFLNIGGNIDDYIKEVNLRPTDDPSLPFLPEYVYATNTKNILPYVGRQVGKCNDNRLRVCKVFMLEFEYEGKTFSFPFLLDNSLDKAALLGKDSVDYINKMGQTGKIDNR